MKLMISTHSFEFVNQAEGVRPCILFKAGEPQTSETLQLIEAQRFAKDPNWNGFSTIAEIKNEFQNKEFLKDKMSSAITGNGTKHFDSSAMQPTAQEKKLGKLYTKTKR